MRRCGSAAYLPSPSRFRRVRVRQIRYVTVMPHAAWIAERLSGPPLRPLSTGIRHRFSGIRHRFLSAVRGAQSRGFARFATRLNPLTPCFVTGKNFLRMRPGAGNGSPISQRFNYPPPLQKIFRLNAALLRTRVGFAPVNPTIGPSNESSLQCQKLTRALPPLPLRVGAGLNELGAFQ